MEILVKMKLFSFENSYQQHIVYNVTNFYYILKEVENARTYVFVSIS